MGVFTRPLEAVHEERVGEDYFHQADLACSDRRGQNFRLRYPGAYRYGWRADMKRTLLSLFIGIMMALYSIALATFVLADISELPPGAHPYSVVRPLQGVSHGAAERAVAAGATLPLWSYTTTSSRDGQSYTGMMVGVSPFANPSATTIIPTQIVPLIVIMSSGATF